MLFHWTHQAPSTCIWWISSLMVTSPLELTLGPLTTPHVRGPSASVAALTLAKKPQCLIWKHHSLTSLNVRFHLSAAALKCALNKWCTQDSRSPAKHLEARYLCCARLLFLKHECHIIDETCTHLAQELLAVLLPWKLQHVSRWPHRDKAVPTKGRAWSASVSATSSFPPSLLPSWTSPRQEPANLHLFP